MSQSLLYHAFGIPKTYRYVWTEFQKGAVWFTVRPEGDPECCPHCQRKEFVGHGQSLGDHAEGLLSYTVTLMTNGRMEGINRKIKTMLRQFYGLRDDDFLRLKLYALHE